MRGLTSDGNLVGFLWGIRFAPLHTPEDPYAGVYAGALAALHGGKSYAAQR